MYSDVSGRGLGCMLMQRDQVIVYTSHQIRLHEKNYQTHDLELVVVIFALKIWSHYLLVSKVEIYIDHNSCKYVITQKNLT